MLHETVLLAQTTLEARGSITTVLVPIAHIIFAIVCASIAGAKGRSALGWGILGFFFSLITLIVVIFIPRKKEPA